MVCELQFISPKLDVEIADAMAIAIAISNPITSCDFRDAQTVMLNLTSEVYGPARCGGKSSRLNKLFKIPTLIHLQLGLSLPRLPIHVSRTYSVLFSQSRKTSDYYYHMYRRYNAFKMKVLGDDTNTGQERIEVIRTGIQNFLSEEKKNTEKQLDNKSEAPLTDTGGQSNTSESLQQRNISSPATVEDILDATPLTGNNPLPILVDSVKKKKMTKKRKSYSVKELKLSYALELTKQRGKYTKDKKNNRPISRIIEEMIGGKLVELVMKQGKYNGTINGKLYLSIRTGIFIQDLICNCGCSLEKMPIIVSTVIRMLFGNVDAASMKKIVKCTKTYTTSSERSAALVKENTSSAFLIRDNESSILNAYLIVDVTNKGNKNLVAKLYNYGDGIVRLGALNLDNTGTKYNIINGHSTKSQAFSLMVHPSLFLCALRPQQHMVLVFNTDC